MIGRHVVSVSADRLGSVWGQPVNPNPFFTDRTTGWSLGSGVGGGGTATWRDGALEVPTLTTGSMSASTAYPWRSLPGDQFRARVLILATNGGNVRIQLRTSPWSSGGGIDYLMAQESWTDAGMHMVDAAITLPPQAASAPYRGLTVQFLAPTAPLRLESAELFMFQPLLEPVDITCLVDTVSINHGRGDTTSQPDASTATVDLAWINGVDTLPDVVEIGAGLFVDTEYPPGSGTLSRRFAGRITDVSYSWEESGADTPIRVSGRLIGAGYVADLARRVIGDEPWPQESDGDRVTRILSLAGVNLDPTTSDPGTVQILPRDVDAQPALDVAHSVADSAGGIIWATRAGELRYADAEHRRGVPISLALGSCDLLVAPEWIRDTDGLTNKVSIGYGPTPEEGEQPRLILTNAASITEFGQYALSLTTELASVWDATDTARLILGRRSFPTWMLSDLPVDIGGLDDDRTAAVLGLDMHDLITVTGMPAAGAAPTTALLFVEGWKETLGWDTHTLDLVVSDYCRTSAPPRWDDMDSALTWNTVDPAVTWDSLTCVPPGVSIDRWTDVPASTRWNTVDPAVNWDAWPATPPLRGEPTS